MTRAEAIGPRTRLRAGCGASRRAGATTASTLEEGLSNVLAVQSLGGNERQRGRFERDSARSFAEFRGLILLYVVTIFVGALVGTPLVIWIARIGTDGVIGGKFSTGDFALFVGHVAQEGKSFPFEVWINGQEQPRAIGALAKTLSMDMRANDRGWLKLKLETLANTFGDDPFDMPLPPHGERKRVPGVVSGVAQVIRYRCEELGALEREGPTPVLEHGDQCQQRRRAQQQAHGEQGGEVVLPVERQHGEAENMLLMGEEAIGLHAQIGRHEQQRHHGQRPRDQWAGNGDLVGVHGGVGACLRLSAGLPAPWQTAPG